VLPPDTGETERSMHFYRIYYLGKGDHISTPRHSGRRRRSGTLGKAPTAANGKVVELWDGSRFIARFPQDEG
jgi:hypothetical protein